MNFHAIFFCIAMLIQWRADGRNVIFKALKIQKNLTMASNTVCNQLFFLCVHISVERTYATWRLLPPSSSACSCLCFCTCRPSFWMTVCVCVCVFAAYFEGLVFHFHDELLLLFLSGAGFLELGLDVVDLHLILHNCRGRAEGSHVGIGETLTSFMLLLFCAVGSTGGKAGERWWCDIIWEQHYTHKAARTRYAP